MAKKSKAKAINKNKTIMIGVGMFLLIMVFIFISQGTLFNKKSSGSKNKIGESVLSEAGDLMIPITDITSTATFYPVEVEGTQLEVLAVKSSDGSIRTAFNTCQICYSSGRGYYEQEDDHLVCQNCGNVFSISQIEVEKGGCNPVPIFSENKTVDEETITISNEYLKEAKGIFANWKL